MKYRFIPTEEFARQWLGIGASEITLASRLLYRLETNTGIIITTVEKRSPADLIGLEKGDVIRQLNNQMINSLDDYRKAILMARQKDSILLLVQRGQYGYYVTLEP